MGNNDDYSITTGQKGQVDDGARGRFRFLCVFLCFPRLGKLGKETCVTASTAPHHAVVRDRLVPRELVEVVPGCSGTSSI
jgi:hypothetical protein